MHPEWQPRVLWLREPWSNGKRNLKEQDKPRLFGSPNGEVIEDGYELWLNDAEGLELCLITRDVATRREGWLMVVCRRIGIGPQPIPYSRQMKYVEARRVSVD